MNPGSFPLRVLLGAGLALGSAAWMVHGVWMLLNPYQFDYGEGAVLALSATLARGEPIYRSLDRPPFLVSPYAPLYLWAGSLFMGEGPTFFGGRLLSVLSCAAVAGMLFFHLRTRAGAVPALAGLAFFLVHPLVLGWSALYRVDFLALAFTAGGLLAADRNRPALAAALLSLAFFTKQSFLAAPAAVLAALLWRPSSRRRAALFAGLLAALLLLPGELLNLRSGGVLFEQLFRFNRLPYDAGQAARYLGHYLVSALGLVVLAGFGLREKRPLWIAYLAASLAAALGSGRFGAFYNYFLEFHLALSVLAALALARREALGRPWLPVMAGIQVLGLGMLCGLPPYLYSPWNHLRYETLPTLAGRLPGYLESTFREAGALRWWLDRHPGPVLAENLGNPVVMGRIPWLCDPATFFKLAELGLWDENRLLDRIDRGEIALVLLQKLHGNIRFPPRVLARILARYEVVGRAGVDLVLLPRGEGEGPPGE